MSSHVQSDVLSDGQISKRFNISTHRPASVGGISLYQEDLLASFKKILRGEKPSPLRGEAGVKLDANVEIQINGTATITVSGIAYSYSFVGLLSPTPERRLGYLNDYLGNLTLSSTNVDSLRAILSRSSFSDEDFLSAVEILQTAQENFVQHVRTAAGARDLSAADLLPASLRYWDNLVAPQIRSNTLAEFLADERSKEVKTLVAGNPIRALHAISLSFCAPGLVPFDIIKNVPEDAVLKALDRLAAWPDHFGLTGSFEICATLKITPEVVAVGDKLLNTLLDLEKLQNFCTFYSGIFAMTIARLAEHSTLGKKPAFWRRITAAAHASLVLRACGADNADSVFQWAMQNSGKTFLLSVLLEMDHEPRWKADWLTSKHLAAGVVRRASQALSKIPEAQRPKSWVDRIVAAQEWVTARQLDLFSILPAIGESARKTAPPEDEMKVLQPLYGRFVADPTMESLLSCAGGVYTVGITDEIVDGCRKIAERLQKDDLRWSEENVRYTAQVLSFVAAESRDTKLADLVADFCIRKIRELPNDGSTLEIICRLIECATADIDREQAMKSLAQRLEGVALFARSSNLPDLYDTILRLQAVAPPLAPMLGKALAAARLG